MARRSEEAFPLLRLQFVRERDGRELRGVQDFVRVSVADATQQTRIRKRSLQRAIFGRERGAKRGKVAREDVDSAGVR